MIYTSRQVISIVLGILSLVFFYMNNVPDAIYVLVGAVLCEPKGEK